MQPTTASSSRFTSRRERWFWVLAAVVVVAIYSTLGLAQVLADRVAEPRTLDHVMFWGAMVVFATIFAAGLVSRPRPAQIVAAVGVIAVYWLAFARMATPADRTHLVEYSVVAILIYSALRERAANAGVPKRPALVAVATTSLIGIIDELVQAVVPSRVFDPIDIGFNVSAAVMTVAAVAVLQGARRVVRRTS